MLTNLRRRLGKFSLTSSLIEDNPEVVMQVMGMCIVVECVQHWASEVLEYTALSPEFAVVEKGSVIPTYDIIITASPNDRVNFLVEPIIYAIEFVKTGSD